MPLAQELAEPLDGPTVSRVRRVAKALMPGGGPGGIVLTVLLGIAGAFVGGFLASASGIGAGVAEFDVRTILVAIVGASVLLFGYQLLTRASGAHA